MDLDVQVTLQTSAGQIVGTLAYMSPEQVMGDPTKLDARTDIYSLGVVAYEALSGRLPLDIRGRNMSEATHAILHDEPTRLRSLDSKLSGDIDTIIAKAMDKDPQRRYQTAAAFAADIRRFLRDEPIFARPASSLYQLRKFAKRNRTLVGGVVATIAALCAGVFTTTYWALQAGQRRVQAEQTADEALRQAYSGSMAAAQAALEGGDAQRARLSLDRAPRSLRGWEWTYLDHLADRSLRTIPFGERGLTDGAIDGDYALLFGRERSPVLLNWQTGERIECDDAKLNGIVALSVSPRGDRFVVCGYAALALYDARTGRVVKVISDTGRFENDVFFPDGDRFVLAHVAPKRLVYYNSSTGEEIRSVALPGTRRSFPCVSPDGNAVAVETTEGMVGLFDAQADRMLWEASGVNPRFSADGSRLTMFDPSLSAATKMVIRKSENGERLGELDLSDSSFNVGGGASRVIGMSRNQRRVGVVQTHGGLRLADADSLRPLMILNGLQPWISTPTSGISYSSDGQHVAVLGEPDCIKVWDANISSNPYHAPGNYDIWFSAADISPDSRFTATGDWGQVAMWDAGTGQPIWSRYHAIEFIWCLSFSPDGRRIAVGSDRGAIRLLDSATGEQVREAFPRGFGEFGSYWASGIAWHPGGKTIFATQAGGELLELDAESLSVVASYPSCLGHLQGLTISGDGRYAAAIRRKSEESLVIWDLQSKESPRVVPVKGPISLAWSPDGRTLGFGTTGGVFLVDPRSAAMRPVAAQPGHYGALAFTPDSTRLAAAAHDQGVCLWSTDNGDLVSVLPARSSVTLSMKFSSDTSVLTCVTGADSVYRFECRSAESGVFARREAQRLACDLVNGLRGEGRHSDQIEARIREAAGMTDAVREAAIGINAVIGDQIAVMNNVLFITMRQPVDHETTLRTLKETELVLKRTDDPYARNVQGIVLYRLGRYQESLEALDAAEAGYNRTRQRVDGWPSMLIAFQAMCHEQLGRHEKAAQLLESMRRYMTDHVGPGKEQDQLFVDEASKLIAPGTSIRSP